MMHNKGILKKKGFIMTNGLKQAMYTFQDPLKRCQRRLPLIKKQNNESDETVVQKIGTAITAIKAANTELGRNEGAGRRALAVSTPIELESNLHELQNLCSSFDSSVPNTP